MRIALAAAVLAPAIAHGQTPLRYSAQFASGKWLDGAEVHDWHDPQAEPRLDSRKLFFAGDHVLWIEDNTIQPAGAPEAFVEFFGGDRLPGRVTEYRTGDESPAQKSPPHLLVAPEAAVDWPEARRLSGVPVLTRTLRRVVWQKRDESRYRPGTLWYLDGRQLEFRALRWTSGAVRLLLEQETREVPFGEIAELHLPRLDPWQAWFDQLAALLPEGTGYVMQVETGDGLRATASSARLSPAVRGDAGNRDHWFHGVQPAWCLEPLWLRHRAIRTRRFFAPHEAPLSAIEPARVVQRSNLAGGWHWQLDRNVHAGPLRCGDHPFGWGFGVHAYSEMAFELPVAARGFRTQYGLDRVVGPGGCVRALIFAGPPGGQPLYKSEAVIGSARTHDSGLLNVGGARELTLVVDPAQDDRPPGADPFEIRDNFDWLQPTVELDSQMVKSEIERRVLPSLTGLAGWTIAKAAGEPCAVAAAWDAQRPPLRRLRIEESPRAGFSRFSRRLEIGEADRFLVLAVCRLEKDRTPSTIQVRVAGKALTELDVPVANAPGDPDPLLVPIERFRGQTVEVDVFHLPQSPQSRVEWRGVGLVEHDPIVRELFEDDPAIGEALTDGIGKAAFDKSEKFSGAGSLRITSEDRNSPAIKGWKVPIRSDPSPGEYRFLRFAWRKRGGKQIGLHLAQSGAFATPLQNEPKESLRYHVGRGVKRDYGRSLQFRDHPPDQWELVTRDLFSDFGAFDLTGLRLVCGDGDAAWFDHIYLARRPQDLDRVTHVVKNPPPDPLANLPPDQKANAERIVLDPARFGEVLAEVAPAFSTAASEQGVWLLKSFRGKDHVVRTHPPAQGKPCILRSPLAVPAGKHAELRLSVAAHPQSDWQLLVFASGQKLYEQLIDDKGANEGWADVTVDLSRFAGQNVVLEVHNHPNNWSNEFAYWSRVEAVSE